MVRVMWTCINREIDSHLAISLIDMLLSISLFDRYAFIYLSLSLIDMPLSISLSDRYTIYSNRYIHISFCV